jgi:hypothetical protein
MGLEMNADKINYMIVSSSEFRTASESLENVAKFKYLGMTLTNRDEVKSRFNSVNTYFYSVQNLLPSCLI